MSKKIKALFGVASTIAVLSMAITANAAITEVNRNYEQTRNSLIVVSPWNAGHRYIKDNNVLVAHERIDSAGADLVYPAKSAIEVVPNPVTADNNDKVIKITKDKSWTNAANFGINQYGNQFPITGIQSVTSFNFMLGGDPINNVKFFTQDGSFKGSDLVKIAYNAETGVHTLTVRTANGGWNSMEVQQNQWYNFTLVADMTAETVEGKYMTIYINGQEMSTIEGGTNGENFTNIGFNHESIFAMFIHPGVTTGEKSAFYYDDYRVYEPIADDATISLVSPVADSTYMGGAKVKLEAKTYMSTGLEMIEKVEYYDGDTLVAESSCAPFECFYTPTSSGSHTITAKMYLIDVRNPIVSEAVTVSVDRTFEESTIIELNDYDGTLPSPGTWRVSDGAESVVIDEAHNKSIKIGGGSGRWLNYILPQAITDGYVKISGEYYLNEHIISTDENGALVTTDNNINNTLVAGLDGTGAGSLPIMQVSGTTLRTYVNKTQSMTNLKAFEKDRWYKVDMITKIKPEGQGYLKIYLDGISVYDAALPELYKGGNVGEANATGLTAVDKIGNVTFAQLWNTGVMTLDNLKISTLEMDSTPIFTSGGTEITMLNEVINNEISATVACEDDDECKLIMAIYDGGRLVDLKVGVFNAAKLESAATFSEADGCDLAGKTVKAFVWSDFAKAMPKTAAVEIK